MRTGWLKTPHPYFHIPCGGWFRRKGQPHDCKDAKNASDLNINVVCEERGYRKGIRWILQQVATIKEIG